MDEDFEKTMRQVAEYLSGKRFHSGGGDMANLKDSWAWKSKQIFVTGIFLQWLRIRLAYGGDGPFKETYAEFDLKLSEIPIPIIPPSDSPLRKVNVLCEIFNALLAEEYCGPSNDVETEVHLSCLQLFYTSIIYLAPFDIEVLFRLDLALTMVSYHAGGGMRDFFIKGQREKDRLLKSNRTKSTKHSIQRQTAIEIFYTVRGRSEMGTYKLASEILKRYPGDKKPSESSVARWIKAEMEQNARLHT